MWFAFGVISLSGFIIGFILFRRFTRWNPKVAVLDGRQYYWSETRQKGKLVSARVGLPVSTHLQFTLKRESVIDRLFKWLGLSVEQELNRLHFDQNIYVVSDDTRLGRIIKYHESLATDLAALFARENIDGFRIKALACNGTHVFVEVKRAAFLGEDPSISGLAGSVLPTLSVLATELGSKSGEAPAIKDYFILKAAILLGISTGLAANAAINGFRVMLVDESVVVDGEALFRLAVMAGVLITVALVVACIMLLGRTSRMHLVFIELVTLGLAGAIGSAWVELRDANRYLDTSAGQQEIVIVQSLRQYGCGKRNRRTCYSVSFGPSQTFPQGFSETVSASTYRSYKQGDKAALIVRDGYLGFRWADMPVPMPR